MEILEDFGPGCHVIASGGMLYEFTASHMGGVFNANSTRLPVRQSLGIVGFQSCWNDQ